MLRALAHTLGALAAVSKLDVDRTDDDRAFFASERDALQGHFEAVWSAHQACERHEYLASQAAQASIEIGDAVLDRGVRNAKARMRLDLKGTSMPDGADHAFPSDVSELTDAERRVEPKLVLQVLGKLGDVPDFASKASLTSDLQGRAQRQSDNFAARDASEGELVKLESALAAKVAAGSDALYRLEKRLLDRFAREKAYVRAFFLDVARPRRRAEPEVPPTPNA